MMQQHASPAQQFCLRWNNYQTNLTNVFDQLLHSESFVDVTLACDGRSIKAHKMVLSACSPYFQALFCENPCQHPIVIMRDIKWAELKAAVEFMYKGEINVAQDQIGPLLKVAESLKIRGLADVNGEHQEVAATAAAAAAVTPEMAVTAASSSAIGEQHSNNNNNNTMQNHQQQEASGGGGENCSSGGGSDFKLLKPTAPIASSNGAGGGAVPPECWTSRPDGSEGAAIVAARSAAATGNCSGRKRRHTSTDGGGGGGFMVGGNSSSNSPTDCMSNELLNEMPPSVEVPSDTITLMSTSATTPTLMASSVHPPQPPPPPNATTTSGLPSVEALPLTLPLPPHHPLASHSSSTFTDDMEIKPGIAEMIREEERAKLLESSHAWFGASTSSIADSYQYQLQSMWQKCWNTNQSIVHNLRFRERGPLKSWRPETMAEAIFSVLKEGLSLSQAARKYDIPYPTFVLYANRVHNMLGPSADGGSDLRPKGRGRPQRILLGVWPDEHIRGVIRTVVFRDSHQLKEEALGVYPRLHESLSIHTYPSNPCNNGPEANVSPNSAAAAAVAAVAQGLRQQMCSMVAAAQQHQSTASHEAATNPVANLVNSLALAGHCANMSSLSTNGGGSGGVGGAASAHGLVGYGHVTSSVRSLSGSPGGSIQDLRISPAESALDSPIASPLPMSSGQAAAITAAAAAANQIESAIHLNSVDHLGMGVSDMVYKPPMGHVFSSPPRPESLFQEDLEELVKPMQVVSAQRPLDPIATIKLEPMAECRSE